MCREQEKMLLRKTVFSSGVWRSTRYKPPRNLKLGCRTQPFRGVVRGSAGQVFSLFHTVILKLLGLCPEELYVWTQPMHVLMQPEQEVGLLITLNPLLHPYPKSRLNHFLCAACVNSHDPLECVCERGFRVAKAAPIQQTGGYNVMVDWCILRLHSAALCPSKGQNCT